MAYQSAVSSYKETKVKTAGQGQLIIMLYNSAVSHLDAALTLMRPNAAGNIEPSNIEKLNKSLLKAQEIISELMVSLDFDQGGEISTNLFSLYTWFNRELMEAGINQDAKRVASVRNQIENLRQTWQEVVNTSAFETPKKEVVGVNIAM